MKRIYRKLFELSGNVCACPSLAYVLFYPELVANRVPYFLAGNEPVQMLGLYYNRFAPKIAYTFADNRALQFLFNVGRVLTLHPPLRRGQFHTLATMRKLANQIQIPKKLSPYKNEQLENVVEALREEPLLSPLCEAQFGNRPEAEISPRSCISISSRFAADATIGTTSKKYSSKNADGLRRRKAKKDCIQVAILKSVRNTRNFNGFIIVKVK